MKIRILLTVCLIALAGTSFAQDVIVTKDSKKINAKVLEVNIDNIRYKNIDKLIADYATCGTKTLLSLKTGLCNNSAE